MLERSKSIKTQTFFKVLLVTLAITRLWSISLFYLFGENSEFTNRFVNDSFHHYQVGILIIVSTFLLRKVSRPEVIRAIGFGIFLEEWPVFLNDLGLKTNYLYHSKVDFIFIFSLIVSIYFLFLRLIKEKKCA